MDLNQSQFSRHRSITHVSELSPSELEQWNAVQIQRDLEELPNPRDPFAPENERVDGFTDEIEIIEWIWFYQGNELILKDFFSWSGDNQDGLIFIGEETIPVLFNEEGYMGVINDQIRSELFETLHHLWESFEHFRISVMHGDCHERHEHCLEQHGRY